MDTFMELANDVVSGKATIPDLLKTIFLHHIDRYGFGLQRSDTSLSDWNDSPPSERIAMLSGGLNVKVNDIDYIVCINEGLVDDMGILLFDTANYNLVYDIPVTWNDICIGWLYRYGSALVSSYTDNSMYKTPQWEKYIKDVLDWIHWDIPPKLKSFLQ